MILMAHNVGEWFRFLVSAVSRPLQTGAFAPSSRFLAQEMIRDIPPGCGLPVVEIGPGTGAITRYLLPRLNSPSAYVGVDLNADFLLILARRFPSVEFVHNSAQNLPAVIKGRSRPASIVCSLPWAFFPPVLQDEILQALIDSLADRGTLSTFAYLHGLLTPAGMRFHRLIRRKFPVVERSHIVWANFPPAVVYHCRKGPLTSADR